MNSKQTVPLGMNSIKIQIFSEHHTSGMPPRFEHKESQTERLVVLILARLLSWSLGPHVSTVYVDCLR